MARQLHFAAHSLCQKQRLQNPCLLTGEEAPPSSKPRTAKMQRSKNSTWMRQVSDAIYSHRRPQ